MATLYYRPQALETIARHILTQYDEIRKTANTLIFTAR